MQLIGIGKSSQINYASAWTDNNDASVCADPSPFATWNDWGASQRDLFIVDMNGEVALHQNITSGIPNNLEETILGLVTPTIDPCELGTVYVSEGHNVGDPEDWIEIFNSGENECSLEGFKLDDSNEFEDLTFGDITLSAGGYWLCYEDAEGCFSSGLGGGGDEIWLSDPDGNTAMVTLLQSAESDGVALSQSFDANGSGCYTQPTPGQANGECITLGDSDPCALGTVYVSEAHNSGDPEDYIEIFNSGDTDCSLLGFRLDDSDEFDDLTFGDVTLLAGGYWLCYEDTDGCFSSGLGGGGDEVWLSDPEGNTSMVTLLSSEESDGISLSQSFDANGVGCYTQPTPGQANSECVTLSNDKVELLPSQIKLYQNYPNPFNPNTTISYSIISDIFVDIKIFDINGKLVRTLLSKEHSKGHHNINWDGTNNRGQLVSAGIYLYTLNSDKFMHTKKMILVK